MSIDLAADRELRSWEASWAVPRWVGTPSSCLSQGVSVLGESLQLPPRNHEDSLRTSVKGKLARRLRDREVPAVGIGCEHTHLPAQITSPPLFSDNRMGGGEGGNMLFVEM